MDIVTSDPAALAAVHQFLKFQIAEHKTGDPTTARAQRSIRGKSTEDSGSRDKLRACSFGGASGTVGAMLVVTRHRRLRCSLDERADFLHSPYRLTRDACDPVCRGSKAWFAAHQAQRPLQLLTVPTGAGLFTRPSYRTAFQRPP